MAGSLSRESLHSYLGRIGFDSLTLILAVFFSKGSIVRAKETLFFVFKRLAFTESESNLRLFCKMEYGLLPSWMALFLLQMKVHLKFLVKEKNWSNKYKQIFYS